MTVVKVQRLYNERKIILKLIMYIFCLFPVFSALCKTKYDLCFFLKKNNWNFLNKKARHYFVSLRTYFKKIYFFVFCTTLIFSFITQLNRHINLVPSDVVYILINYLFGLMSNHYLNSNVRFYRLNKFQTFAIHERPHPCPIFAW